MSQIPYFYMMENNKLYERSNGGCSGDVYMAIWDDCEAELDMDVRIHALHTEDVLDCVLLDEKMAEELLMALQERGFTELAAEIGADWDISQKAVQRGLETLCAHLADVQNEATLLYQMT